MRIIIEISDEKQAETFLTWVKYRGDMLLSAEQLFTTADGTSFNLKVASEHDSYIYVMSAEKMPDE